VKKKKFADKSDWERVDAMKDKDIDDSEIPEIDEKFFKRASFRWGKESEIIEPSILIYFKKFGNDYKERINALLKAHIAATSKNRILSKGKA